MHRILRRALARRQRAESPAVHHLAALTTYCLAAIVSERRRPAQELAESQRREGELAALERQRIARDLLDSVSQSLFSTTLHVRTAQHALTEQASALSAREGLVIEVDGPGERLPLRPEVEEQLYRLGQEALANVVKHARASRATVRIAAKDDTVSHRGVRRRPRLRSGRRGPRTLRPAVDARPSRRSGGPDRGHKHPRPRHRPTRRGTGPALMAHADRTIRWITPCG
jgi:signal transduction histidine kinase